MLGKKMITVNVRDAKKLTSSIVEVDAYRSLYEKAAIQSDYSPQAFKDLLSRYMSTLKKHKSLWKEMLLKYIGEEDASYYRDMYKFDIIKNVIFLEMGVIDNATEED